MAAINDLKDFAHDHYNEGGHWVFECFDAADYQEYLDDANGDLDQARVALREYWDLMEEQCRAVRNEIF